MLARLCQCFILVLSYSLTQQAFSGTHLSLSGSLTNNNLGLNTQLNRSVSASVAFDMGRYFRIGMTHRQVLNQVEGYKENSWTGYYRHEKERTKSVANSIDFTLILYYGRIWVPYVQLGFVKKDYYITYTINRVEIPENHISLEIVPNAGVGVGIRMSQRFSLKIAYSISKGLKQKNPFESPEEVWDSYTSLGLSYNF